MRIYVPIRPSRNRMLDDETEDEFNKEFDDEFEDW